MIETADELSPEELAYQRSDVMTWRGQELQPFSYLRKTAAMAFMRYTSMPEPVIVIWLGLQTDKKVKQARSEPESVEDEIDRWAERENVLDGVTPEPEMQRVYDTIMLDIAASMSRPVEKDDDSKKKQERNERVSELRDDGGNRERRSNPVRRELHIEPTTLREGAPVCDALPKPEGNRDGRGADGR